MLALLAQSGTAVAQDAPVKVETKRYSDTLGIAGLATILVGAVLMVPMDDPTAKSYSFEGTGTYCADTNTSNGNVRVTTGGCDPLPAMRTAGLVTMGAGVVMALVGFHKVTVSPQVGRKTVGANVSVKW